MASVTLHKIGEKSPAMSIAEASIASFRSCHEGSANVK